MRVSKTSEKIVSIFSKVAFLCFALGILHVIDIVMPRTRAYFNDYQAYLDNRIVRESYGSIHFEKELPIGAEDIKYYAEHVIVKKVTAYSMILPEDTYMDFKESRINFYMEEADDQKACSLLYALQGDEQQYIDSLELYDVKLDYVDNVLHHPEARQQYYFGVIMKTNTSHECYNGIIANDSAREIIEFSAELPDDYGEYKEPERHSGSMGIFDWISLFLPIALIVLIIKGMYVLDKKLDEKRENKANKD